MAVQFNHTLVWCHDKEQAAGFVTEILGLPPAVQFADFLVVELANGVSLDFAEKSGPVSVQHYAFLIGEDEFDAIYDRIRERGLEHWADPMRRRPGEINRNDGGRGVYFEGPDGHFLEVITRPYGG
jgi:catechol 2,3-dioxygenase-like lactoylglutathione lyase family enzyme